MTTITHGFFAGTVRAQAIFMKTPKTPGVYINELNSFPSSIVPVATAVPAFVGYTRQAEYKGKSCHHKTQKISSFADYQAIYMARNPAPPADPAKQYAPQYYLTEQDQQPEKGDSVEINGKHYSVVPDPATIYYLHNSIRLFYENGGGDAYIVSVGTYGAPSGSPMAAGDRIVNPNVRLDDLLAGLTLLKDEEEPTMYVCPEATLLDTGNNSALMKSMLLQAEEMGTAICILDVTGGDDPDPLLWPNDIDRFRESVGSRSLSFGTAYYPFVKTTISRSSDIDYTNLFGGDMDRLRAILDPADRPNPAAARILDDIETPPPKPLTVSQYDSALTAASTSYALVMQHVLAQVNTLPPSAGMAGVYSLNDSEVGVWHAPANVTIASVVGLPIHLNDRQQSGLNVDAVSGKSINALRSFAGQGILIWGARTLDGNSLDWRYIQVRRTMIFLEQSCRVATGAFVFEPNQQSTWVTVKTMISDFLTSVWKAGGLAGSTAAAAFQVEVGLGTTMTPQDIVDGVMNVVVKVAVAHPAEFIEFTIRQELAATA